MYRDQGSRPAETASGGTRKEWGRPTHDEHGCEPNERGPSSVGLQSTHAVREGQASRRTHEVPARYRRC